MCLHAPLPLLLGSLLYPPSKAWPSWLSTPTELTNQWRNYKSIAVLTLLNLRKKKESFLCEHTSFHWISWLSEKHQEKILSWPGCETSTPTLFPHSPSRLHLSRQNPGVGGESCFQQYKGWADVEFEVTVPRDPLRTGYNQPSESLQVLNFCVRAPEFNNSC